MPRFGEYREITLPDGKKVGMFIDGWRPAPKPCFYCGRPGVALCDWPDKNHKSGTCDKSLCKIHAMKPIPTFGKPETADIDYCPEHYHLYQKDMLEIKKDSPLEP
jgi:hypothetical protein